MRCPWEVQAFNSTRRCCTTHRYHYHYFHITVLTITTPTNHTNNIFIAIISICCYYFYPATAYLLAAAAPADWEHRNLTDLPVFICQSLMLVLQELCLSIGRYPCSVTW